MLSFNVMLSLIFILFVFVYQAITESITTSSKIQGKYHLSSVSNLLTVGK